MEFNASRVGCTLEHLQQSLIEALKLMWDAKLPWWHVVEVSFVDAAKQEWWDRAGAAERGIWVLCQLKDCMDIVPGYVCRLVGIPLGFTFAKMTVKLRVGLDVAEYYSTELGLDLGQY